MLLQHLLKIFSFSSKQSCRLMLHSYVLSYDTLFHAVANNRILFQFIDIFGILKMLQIV